MAVKDYITELAQKAGLTPELTASLVKATENPEFAKELENGIQRQSEFSRSMDQLRANQATWTKWHEDNKAYVTELEAKAAGRTPTTPTATGLTQEQIDKQIKDATDRTLATNLNITKQALRVMDDYRARFGKGLDPDALEKFALEKNLTIDQAYKEMIAPEVKAAETAAHEKALKDAADNAVKEYASKHNLPVDNAPADSAGVSPFYATKPETPLTEGQRARNFADSWTSNAGA